MDLDYNLQIERAKLNSAGANPEPLKRNSSAKMIVNPAIGFIIGYLLSYLITFYATPQILMPISIGQRELFELFLLLIVGNHSRTMYQILVLSEFIYCFIWGIIGGLLASNTIKHKIGGILLCLIYLIIGYMFYGIWKTNLPPT